MAEKTPHLHMTDCGLSGIGKIPYGAHFCHFYAKRQDLIDSLIPYFQAGLQNNERCLWLASDPLPAEEATAEIEQAMPEIADKIGDGQVRILDAPEFFDGTQWKDGKDQLGLWLSEEKKALREGYQGLRLAGNTSFISSAEWDAFMAFEDMANRAMESRRIVALCSYRLIQCQSTDLFEVIRNHQLTLQRREKDWEVIEKTFSSMTKAPSRSSGASPPATAGR